MCISELLAALAFKAVDFKCLEPVIVFASDDFARLCADNDAFDYNIAAGYHFGTLFRHDLESGPPTTVEQLADPLEVLRLWVLDCWLMNIDRDQHGNVMLEPAQKGKWSLVASDNSECFYGSGYFQTGDYLRRAEQSEKVKYLDCFEPIVQNHGVDSLKTTIEAAKKCAVDFRSITECVPAEWWDRSGVEPEKLEQCMRSRADRLSNICEVRKWEELANATRGAIPLPFDV
jgi:hypothetical protein